MHFYSKCLKKPIKLIVKCSLEINSLKTNKERGTKLKLFCTPFFNKYPNLGKEIIDAREDKMNQQVFS